MACVQTQKKHPVQSRVTRVRSELNLTKLLLQCLQPDYVNMVTVTLLPNLCQLCIPFTDHTLTYEQI